MSSGQGNVAISQLSNGSGPYEVPSLGASPASRAELMNMRDYIGDRSEEGEQDVLKIRQ